MSALPALAAQVPLLGTVRDARRDVVGMFYPFGVELVVETRHRGKLGCNGLAIAELIPCACDRV